MKEAANLVGLYPSGFVGEDRALFGHFFSDELLS
jgi:hypothetical protein